MRDPNRIEEIIELVKEIWIAFPDLRLGQLISNACAVGGWDTNDVYYCEDDIILKGLKLMTPK